MNKVRIHDLNYCQAELTELDNIVGGKSLFFEDDGFFVEELEEEPMTLSTDFPMRLISDSVVEERVTTKDGGFAQTRVERGRINNRKFIRSTSRAKVL